MLSLFEDARYAFRTLRKSPGVTAAAIGILAVAIGANTALFAAMNAVLLRAVPGIRDPGELVRFIRLQKGEYSNFGYPDYLDYRDRSLSFSGIVAERVVAVSFTADTAELASAGVVTGNYFATLGVQPSTGRLLTPDDDRVPGAHPVAVLSHRFWKRIFSGDPAAVGRRVQINGQPFHIVGVASEAFEGMTVGARVDLWVPIMMQRAAMPRYTRDFLPLRGAGWIALHGRLRPGVALDSAAAELRTIAHDLERTYPDTNRERSVAVSAGIGRSSDQRRSLQSLFLYLFAGVGLILLIACANLANLFLARAVARQREIAVRLALGAGPGRLFRQFLTEALLLSAAAAGFGLALAPAAVRLAVETLHPADVAFRAPVAIDSRVLFVTAGLTVFASLLFGAAPALRALGTDIAGTLKLGPHSGAGIRGRLDVRQALVAAQIALAFSMLLSGGLLLRAIGRIRAIDTGFRTGRVLLAAIDLSLQRYSDSAGKDFTVHLVRSLAAQPGVESVSISKSEPARDWSDRRPIYRAARDQLQPGLNVDANRVTPGYFDTLGMQLAAGRDFTWQDRDGAPRVCILSESLARKLWPRESALGRRVVLPQTPGELAPPLEVVGIARDSRYRSVLADPPLLVYEPLLQDFDSSLSLQVRTAADPAPFAPMLKRGVAGLDPFLAVSRVRTFAAQVEDSLWEERAATGLACLFSVVALALAAIGLYASLAYTVSRRARELAIRMALGAEPARVLAAFLCDAAAVGAAGLALGAVVCVPLLKLGRGYLYGVPALDPAAWIGAALTVLAIMLAASYVTARRATLVDPVVVLREQ